MLGAIIGSSLFIQQAAVGQSVWNGGTGSYSTAGNWSPSGVPGTTADITINAGTATLASGNLDRAGDTSIAGGNLVISSGRFLNANGGASDFTISSGSLRHTGNYFILGTNNAGTFTQTGGTVTSTVDRGFFTSDGGGQTSSLTVSGGSFSVVQTGTYNDLLHNTFIGRNGANDSVLINGGNFSVTNISALPAPASTGRRFLMGKDSSFEIESGTATIANMEFVVVGTNRVSSAGTSSFDVNGGTTTISVTKAFTVGGGVNGTLSITDGSFDILRAGGGGGHLWIDDGSTTSSALVNQSGGVFTIEGDIVLGRDSTGTTATFTMTGGELYANTIVIGAHPKPLFEFFGGDIFLTGNQTSVINQPWFDAATGTTATFNSLANQTHIYVIPEPATVSLLGLGVLALGFRRSRQNTIS